MRGKDDTDKMTRRNGAGVKLVLLVAVGGLVLYGLYSFHDLHTKLKSTEEKADRLRQQHDSLSAQLQVVYEHKTRLEKSLQQEKSDHKKSKDGLTAQKAEVETRFMSEKQELLNRINSINQEHKLLQSQHEDRQSELGKLQEQHEKMQEDHRQQVEQHNQEYQQLRQEKENEAAQLKDQIANIQRRQLELQNKLEIELQNNQANQNQIQIDQEQLYKLRSQISDLQNQIQIDQEQLYKLKSQISDLQNLNQLKQQQFDNQQHQQQPIKQQPIHQQPIHQQQDQVQQQFGQQQFGQQQQVNHQPQFEHQQFDQQQFKQQQFDQQNNLNQQPQQQQLDQQQFNRQDFNKPVPHQSFKQQDKQLGQNYRGRQGAGQEQMGAGDRIEQQPGPFNPPENVDNNMQIKVPGQEVHPGYHEVKEPQGKFDHQQNVDNAQGQVAENQNDNDQQFHQVAAPNLKNEDAAPVNEMKLGAERRDLGGNDEEDGQPDDDKMQINVPRFDQGINQPNPEDNNIQAPIANDMVHLEPMNQVPGPDGEENQEGEEDNDDQDPQGQVPKPDKEKDDNELLDHGQGAAYDDHDYDAQLQRHRNGPPAQKVNEEEEEEDDNLDDLGGRGRLG